MVESINVIVDDIGSRLRECDDDKIDVSKNIEVIEENFEDEKLSKDEENKDEQGKKRDKSKERREIWGELIHQRKISQGYLRTIR